MEEETSALFSLSIDEAVRGHLLSIAKWNKFLGISGIIISSIFVLSAIVGNTVLYKTPRGVDEAYAAGEMIGQTLFYLILVAAYLIPSIYRLRFANRMVRALANEDQHLLASSLAQFKIFTKFFGIATIVLLALGIIGIIVVMADAMHLN